MIDYVTKFSCALYYKVVFSCAMNNVDVWMFECLDFSCDKNNIDVRMEEYLNSLMP
jgi:hypothetical protein